ncbi:hypothetical protein HBB16_06070 [Pseudonocardia sp. MCCB 268]|nr:hypothetical protein [Pseudonocardia cytotoxica]
MTSPTGDVLIETRAAASRLLGRVRYRAGDRRGIGVTLTPFGLGSRSAGRSSTTSGSPPTGPPPSPRCWTAQATGARSSGSSTTRDGCRPPGSGISYPAGLDPGQNDRRVMTSPSRPGAGRGPDRPSTASSRSPAGSRPVWVVLGLPWFCAGAATGAA